MATITILQKPSSKKMSVELDLNQWEKLADIFGFYNADFIKTLRKSLRESRSGKVKKINSLLDLEK